MGTASTSVCERGALHQILVNMIVECPLQRVLKGYQRLLVPDDQIDDG